jgi:beta-lactamase regulating signal transducer with metallopeptidase domain/thiol-disulfide isomerase/thioredoxin
METLIVNLNAAGQAFVQFAGPMLVQASILIAVLILLDFALRKQARAVVRYALWMTVLVKLVLPPSLAFPTAPAYWIVQAPAEPAFVPAAQTSSSVVSVAAPAPARIVPQQPIASTQPPAATRHAKPMAMPRAKAVPSGAPLKWQGALLIGWASVAALLLAWVLCRYKFVGQLRRSATACSPDLSALLAECREQLDLLQPVELKITNNTMSPGVCGLLRPVILMPARLCDEMSRPQMRAVLLHELAHIKRGDLWINHLQTLLQIIYWYNPLLWLANAIIRRVREEAVDETVMVEMGREADAYPTTLVHVARLTLLRPSLSLGLVGIMESKGSLRQRIHHLLDRPVPKTARVGFWGMTGVIAFGALALPMAHGSKATVEAASAPIRLAAANTASGREAGGANAGSPFQDSAAAVNSSEASPLDLSGFYDLTATEATQFGVWEVVPKGPQIFGGTAFNVDGMIRLYGVVPPPHGTRYRNEVAGIPVGQCFGALHILHGTGWTTEDGTLIARVVFNYSNGQQASFPIVYGDHVRDWWKREKALPDDVFDPNSKVVWEGNHSMTGIRFYKTTLSNPHPEWPVQTLDLVSENSAVTPAIVALSVGPAVRLAVQKKARSLNMEPTKKLLLEVVDDATGRPIQDVGISVTSCDEGCHLVGVFKTDAEGKKVISYGMEIKSLSIWLRKEGYQQEVMNWNPSRGEQVAGSYTVRMTSGRVIGGMVRDGQGRPVANATLAIEGALLSHRGTFSTINDHVQTDASGAWSFNTLPRTVDEFTLSVQHPNFPITMFQCSSTGGAAGEKMIALRDLLARKALLGLGDRLEPGASNARIVSAPLDRVGGRGIRQLQVGDPAPRFETKTIDGQPLRLADFAGKYVLIDFWATWCGPCVKEMPALKSVYEKFGGDERFVMISLSLDLNIDLPTKFVAKSGLKWPQGFLGGWESATLPSEYGVQGIPAIFLIAPDGTIAAKDLRGEAIGAAVERVLARP